MKKSILRTLYALFTIALITLVAWATGTPFQYAVVFVIIGIFGVWLQMIAEAS